MKRRFSELAFTPAVHAEQTRRGPRAGYVAASAGAGDGASSEMTPGEQEIAFIAARGSFYLASVSETGWPHVQHGSGPTGFVRSVNDLSAGRTTSAIANTFIQPPR